MPGLPENRAIDPQSLRANEKSKETNNMANHPELNGNIYFKTGDPRIWWIDGGQARWIVDEDTYHGVFGGSPSKVEEDLLSDIDVGPNVGDGTVLVRGGSAAAIYLVDQNLKRLIPSESVKSKYQLNGNVHSIPPYALASIATGSPFA
jgi:hypothetical protein